MDKLSLTPGAMERISNENPAPQGTYYHLEEINNKHVEVQLRSKRRLNPFPKIIDYVAFLHHGDPETAMAKAMKLLASNNKR